MRILIGIGSNFEPQINVPHALAELAAHPALTLVAASAAYRGPAKVKPGAAPQPPYWNAAAVVETDLSPIALKQVLRGVEDALGRMRAPEAKAIVPIDLDLLLPQERVEALPPTDRAVFKLAELQEPYHLIPAAEIAPDWIDPGSGRSLRELADGTHFVELEKVQ